MVWGSDSPRKAEIFLGDSFTHTWYLSSSHIAKMIRKERSRKILECRKEERQKWRTRAKTRGDMVADSSSPTETDTLTSQNRNAYYLLQDNPHVSPCIQNHTTRLVTPKTSIHQENIVFLWERNQGAWSSLWWNINYMYFELQIG